MHSMTGFGRGEAHNEQLSATVEISGVNRKQAEVVLNLRRDLSPEIEPKVRPIVLASSSRGRVQVNIKLEPAGNAAPAARIDTARAQAYHHSVRQLAETLGESLTLTTGDLIRLGDVFLEDEQELDADSAWELIQPALLQALDAFNAMRRSEGEGLLTDLSERVATIESLATQMAERAPQVVTNHREALHKRLAEAGLPLPLDDERLLREIGLFAERCDISEEITRLHLHIAKFREFFASSDPVGRPLDFLCQETNREFNTIGSKANDAPLAQLVVAAKTELEKIREQVQNIE